MSFIGRGALALTPADGEALGDTVAVLLAFDAAAWRALAGRAVPDLADGPVRLAFPPVPDALSWAEEPHP